MASLGIEQVRHLLRVDATRQKARELRGDYTHVGSKKAERETMTLKQFNEMVELADGICQICRERKDLVVDHDHKTGKIRGLICRRCNSALGYWKDSPENLLRAIEYIKEMFWASEVTK